MGKVICTGRAKENYLPDICDISLVIKWKAETADVASTKMTETCEQFLLKLEEIGIDLKEVRLSEDCIKEEKEYTGGKYYLSSRTVVVRVPAMVEWLNAIRFIVGNSFSTIEMSPCFKNSNIKEIEDYLISEAVLDSKRKAEIMAQTMGLNVIAMEEITLDGITKADGTIYPAKWNIEDFDDFIQILSEKNQQSNQLTLKEIEREKTVSITWIIE